MLPGRTHQGHSRPLVKGAALRTALRPALAQGEASSSGQAKQANNQTAERPDRKGPPRKILWSRPAQTHMVSLPTACQSSLAYPSLASFGARGCRHSALSGQPDTPGELLIGRTLMADRLHPWVRFAFCRCSPRCHRAHMPFANRSQSHGASNSRDNTPGVPFRTRIPEQGQLEGPRKDSGVSGVGPRRDSGASGAGATRRPQKGFWGQRCRPQKGFWGQRCGHQKGFWGQRCGPQKGFWGQRCGPQKGFWGQRCGPQKGFWGQRCGPQKGFWGQRCGPQKGFWGKRCGYQKGFGGQRCGYQKGFGGQRCRPQKGFWGKRCGPQKGFGGQRCRHQKGFWGQRSRRRSYDDSVPTGASAPLRNLLREALDATHHGVLTVAAARMRYPDFMLFGRLNEPL